MIKNYRMHVTKPKGLSSKQALQYIGWTERRMLKNYMLRNNQHKIEVPTRYGFICVQLVLVDKAVTMCKVSGCDNKAVAKHLCYRHYKQIQRKGVINEDIVL